MLGKCLVFSLFVLTASGCKIMQSSNDGGRIESQSGQNDCAANQTCEINIPPGAAFSDVFTAVPEPGFYFIGWGKGLCSSRLGSCAISDPNGKFSAYDLEVSVSARFSNSPLSVGGDHVCAIRGDNLHCWGGENGYGQTDVPKLTNPDMVVAGTYNTCARAEQGVVCWGAGAPKPLPTPPAVSGSPKIAGSGGGHFCVIDGGAISCWGDNNAGQLDVPALTNPTKVGAGDFHSCALDSEGVKCWGGNHYLHQGEADVPPLSSPVDLAVGANHTCAIDDNSVVCWGDNGKGQQKVPRLQNPQKIVAGHHHTCALDEVGVSCWGGEPWIDGTGTWPDLGQAKVPPLSNVRDIHASGNLSCALVVGGWQCWGQHEGSGLPVPYLTNSGCFILDGELDCLWSDPILLNAPNDLGQVYDFNLGSFACAGTDQGIRCWRTEDNSGIGAFPNGGQSDPPDNLTGVTSLFTASHLANCADTESGVRCWPESGFNAGGAAEFEPSSYSNMWDTYCGINVNGVSCSDPALNATMPSFQNPIAIAVGQGNDPSQGGQFPFASHACVIDAGAVKCWGHSEDGQANPPTIIGAKAIDAGLGYSCALTDTAVICWGAITQTPPLRNPYFLSAGDFYPCALDETGVVCWDGNGNLPVPGPLKIR